MAWHPVPPASNATIFGDDPVAALAVIVEDTADLQGVKVDAYRLADELVSDMLDAVLPAVLSEAP